MNSADRLLSRTKGLLAKTASIIRECNDAQRRMAVINTAPDRLATRRDVAPDTYAEFLFRTSGVLQREPSARARGAVR